MCGTFMFGALMCRYATRVLYRLGLCNNDKLAEKYLLLGTL
jgi:hypothetical protein